MTRSKMEKSSPGIPVCVFVCMQVLCECLRICLDALPVGGCSLPRALWQLSPGSGNMDDTVTPSPGPVLGLTLFGERL